MTNYHKSADGTWKRCRATKRAGGGVSRCPVGKYAHSLGMQGIAEGGGGVILEKRGSGIATETTISKFKNGVFTATSASGKLRYYLADGRLLTKQERLWLSDPLLSRRIRFKPLPRKAFRLKKMEESHELRPVTEFFTHDFHELKLNSERDTFQRWYEARSSALGVPEEARQLRFGHDSPSDGGLKEPDIVLERTDSPETLGAELVELWINGEQAAYGHGRSSKYQEEEIDTDTFMEAAARTLEDKLNKHYDREHLTKMALVIENKTGRAVEKDELSKLQRFTRSTSSILDEAWLIEPDGSLIQLGLNR